MTALLVVVRDSNLISVAVPEPEDDAVLIVHSDAPVSDEIALQLLQTVRRRRGQVHQIVRRVQRVQFSERDAPKLLGEARLPCKYARERPWIPVWVIERFPGLLPLQPQRFPGARAESLHRSRPQIDDERRAVRGHAHPA